FPSTISVVTPASAQADSIDTLTITTYYPSPHGEYRDLEIRRSVKYKPLPDLSSSTIPGPAAGQLVYLKNSTFQGFQYYNGTQWLALSAGGGGAGARVITRSCSWQYDWRSYTGCGYGWGNQCSKAGECCTPPACPAGLTDIGTDIAVTSVFCPGNLCRWDTCNPDTHPMTTGMVIRICLKN
ncbi:MAG: hypothetical protein PHT59_03040, partial [Candidatus Omnitrophica bacterium]|nr:hypothetical protein [Candidatus Omnitrophota bacterium]